VVIRQKHLFGRLFSLAQESQARRSSVRDPERFRSFFRVAFEARSIERRWGRRGVSWFLPPLVLLALVSWVTIGYSVGGIAVVTCIAVVSLLVLWFGYSRGPSN